MAELKIGTKVKDRYTLKEFKGSGSFGEVWLAHDEVLDCDVAIKIYISLDHRGIEEFKSEYITTQGISHPNLLTTTYFDVWEQRPYLVMKYCAKGSSSEQAGKMDEYALWQFIHDVAAGLKYLHNMPEPIIHQDIKPDNILVDDSDRYLITDFGISKKIRSTMRKQSKRAVGAGATAYMGPERFESDPTPVKASDIWSLGASIYELATGELPFSGLGGGMQRSGAEMPVLDNKWSKDMTMVMQSCLAKETWDRPTAQQLEEYSDAIIKGQPAKATWTLPTGKVEEQTPEQSEPDTSSIYGDNEDEEQHSNKKRVWIAIGAIIAAVILLILIWPSNKEEKSIVIPEDTVEAVDTVAVEVVEEKVTDIPEVEPKKATEEPTATPSTPKIKKEEPKAMVEAPKSDNNATLLKNALANGDYQQVQKLANQGYAAAYGPIAKYYLNNHDYKTAESYAKKAKAAGFSDGASVLKTLENLGYYD
ncbi:serine/threonine-protein kinase [Bacteroides acidifaciens]|uniref:serine/threonine-protein kinase n=1 Tax=Bacteroides acidifaciens TaxID=85831 RepID=UPI0025581443|nr:serine/threonine-protein kinase [Bacteroides acidifaciens]